MKVGDIFYSVMQKDNCPFEKPRIAKFVIKGINNNYSYPIISLKQDRWGRYYRFQESQIYLTYKEALVEKNKIIEKIKSWEKEKAERDKLYFEEQEKKEKQRQLDHDKQVRKEVCEEIWKEFETRLMNKTEDMPVMKVANIINSVLDKVKGETK